jgi:hypothetical protein
LIAVGDPTAIGLTLRSMPVEFLTDDEEVIWTLIV